MISLPDPVFPPALTGHASDAPNAFDEACAGAISGRFGGGDIVWSRDVSCASAAIVLEPDVSLQKTAELVPLMMVAIGDALGAIGPPNLAITYRWPSSILANGAIAGRVRFSGAEECAPAETPAYAVIGFDLSLTENALGVEEPGYDLRHTVLHLEGAGDIERSEIIEAVARHFLSWLDGWQQDGFRPVHQAWLGRAHDFGPDGMMPDDADELPVGLDEHGGLIVRRGGKTEIRNLLDAFQIRSMAHG